jgi:type III restriction enzyme
MRDDFAFIWISVNDLSKQSKISFEKNLEWTNLIFSQINDIKDKILQKNEILFINWESIRSISKETWEWKVLAMKDNEKDENLPTYLKNSHENWIKIILIVDESQRSLDTPKAQELIRNYIKPILQIEVSATPDSTGYSHKIEVDINEVIKEGMIKKEILVNEKLKEFHSWDLETDRLIIDIALKKQKELENAYKNEIPLNKGEWKGDFIKPLVLIQLPSESKQTSPLDKSKLDRILFILQNHYNITFENQNLAIWLSEDKTNKDLIDIDNSPVEVLIFKQAIAIGWDCPRAQILVMFREIKSVVFEIQTVWRILRMPQQKHYTNEILNKAYIYTDLPKAQMWIWETAKNLIKNLIWVRNNDLYRDFLLPSFYKKRGDYKDLWLSFYHVLAKTFVDKIWWKYSEFERIDNLIKLEKYHWFTTDDWEISQQILSDGKILVDIDNHTWERIIAETEIQTYAQEELIKLTFDDFARNQVWPQFTNIARSYTSVIEWLYFTLDYYFYWKLKQRLFYQKLILKNTEFFINLLNEAKDIYKPMRNQEVYYKKQEAEKIYSWSIPKSQWFSDTAILKDYKKNILQPSYIQKESENEILFIEQYLELSNEVLFWYKNWDNSEEFLWISYIDTMWEKRTFYPDFIVYFRSWIIWIFDPKSWFTLQEWVNKAIWLETYINNQKKNWIQLIWWLIEIRKIPGNATITLLINKIWNYTLENRADFCSFWDEYIKNYFQK